jgi:hypothetical protein
VEETKKKIKLFMAIPSIGDRSDTQCYALRELEKNYGEHIEFVYPEVLVVRIFHDFARNAYVEEFLKTDCDVMWFLDSDVSPNIRVLDLITKHYDKWQLAGAPYPVFMQQKGWDGPQIVFTVYKKDGRGFYPTAIPREGTDFVDGVATGCIFIKKEVFTKVSKPYFEFKYNTESREMTEGEDLGFCRKVSEQGYRFFIDYSMVCKHYKRVELLDVNNYAITYANQAYKHFEKEINRIVTAHNLAKLERQTKKDLSAYPGLADAPSTVLLKR